MSTCNPLAYSLIRDYFPPSKIATANSIYSSAVYVGNAIASLNIILIKTVGWRAGYRYMGIYGMGLSVLTALILVEPPRERFVVVKLHAEPETPMKKRVKSLTS